VIQRAIDRGEVRPEQFTERIARLPVELFRYEILMMLQPLSDGRDRRDRRHHLASAA
jgi:hypothetical protein